MLTLPTKLRLAELLYTIADSELRAEVVRQVLAEKDIFEPYAAFRRIAFKAGSFITSQDLREFLLSNNTETSPDEAEQLVQIFDTNQDNKLSFTEFLNAVLPKDDAELRQHVTLRPTYELEPDERLPYDIEYSLARILEEELRNNQRIVEQRRKVMQSHDFTTASAFQTLDYCSKNFLAYEDFTIFMEEMGRPIEDSEIKALFRRIDLDLDSKIVYAEFLEAIFPDKSTYSTPNRHVHTHSEPRRSHVGVDEPILPVVRPLYSSPRRNGEAKEQEYKEYLQESYRRSRSPPEVLEPTYQTPRKSKTLYSEEYKITEPLSERKKSPLKANEEEELVKALKQIVNSSRLLESMKNDLALRHDFNLFDAFRYFDTQGKGAYINSKQFEEGCRLLNVFPTKDEIFLFFRKCDMDYDGYLRFTDFCALFTPKTAEFSKLLTDRAPHYTEDEQDLAIFTPQTEQLLSKVLQTCIENEIQAEGVRQRLSHRPLFNLFDAFRAIDKSDQNLITIEDLKELLDDYGVFVSFNDLNGLVERFKGSESKSGRISYSEFVREMTPKSMKVYN